MKRVELSSFAKINLCLDVMGKDQSAGKHFLNTIFYRMESPQDQLVLEYVGDGVNRLTCSRTDIPTDSSNTIMKSLEVLGERGWSVHLEKNIPTHAGLGGGSGNAGSLLKYFGKLRNIPEDHLLNIAQQIGADVPFFVLEDNVAYAEGFGDQIIQSWSLPALQISLTETGLLTSTPEAYARLDLDACGKHSVKTEALLKVLNNGESLTPAVLKSYIHNDFEDSFFGHHPEWVGKGNLCGSGGTLWSFA